jgi:hypothetical protein
MPRVCLSENLCFQAGGNLMLGESEDLNEWPPRRSRESESQTIILFGGIDAWKLGKNEHSYGYLFLCGCLWRGTYRIILLSSMLLGQAQCITNLNDCTSILADSRIKDRVFQRY